jgi:serine phosphatase RsbU (regulator of sigma subunit)
VITRYRTGEQRLRLGGDFVGSVVLPESGVLHFVIGDVSGRGPDAAALGATLRSTWRALIIAGVTIPELIAVMGKVLTAERVEPNAFATIVVGSVDTKDNSLRLANVGHLPPLLITDRVTSLDTPPTPPLGFNNARDIQPWCFPLSGSWSLFCYTDGLIDVRLEPDSRERYGEARLKRRLEAWSGTQPDGDALDALMSEIETPSGGSFADDVAVLLLSTKDGA